MHRNPHSHKGENGKVMIIGGSKHQHGAPLFSALAAEASGVDLLYVAVPARHEGVVKQTSLNFQVHSFAGDALAEADLKALLELLATMDAAVIGPGLGRTPKEQGVIQELIEACPCAMVLDASALQSWTLDAIEEKAAVLTPHLGELERMGIAQDEIDQRSISTPCTILCKGPIDRITGADGRTEEITGGNAGLTIGGTGDALAGLTAGLMAQHMDVFDACVLASKTIKKAGEKLKSHYTTRDVIGAIPELLKKT